MHTYSFFPLRVKQFNILQFLRITLEAAAAFFITAAAVRYGVASTKIGMWFASLQIIPATLSLSLAVLAFWLSVTLVFGRIYCSTVCPLGALMDLGARARSTKKIFRFKKNKPSLRSTCFIIAALLLIFSSAAAARWIDPYGLYVNIVTSITSPEVISSTIVCIVTLFCIALISYKRGRILCNTLCPIGALLGAISLRSAFHIDINTDLCIQCRKCSDVCKAECINLNDHTADMSRCVVCFNCLPVCPNDAIHYTLNRHTLSTPLMQKIIQNKPSTTLACNNTSTSCKTSSTTELSKPTEPEPEL